MDPENYSGYFLQAFPSSPADPFSFLSSSATLPPFPSSDSVPISLPKSHDFPINPSLLLPSLCSLENPALRGEPSSAPKRVRLPTPPPAASTQTKRPNENARRRREKFGEKTRCLQKMLPWTKKMDLATVLEEAGKYVRFLQTQVAVLEAMPISSSFGQVSVEGSGVVGPLGMLNRQQILQVLLNSPVAQTLLSDMGLCVFSYEQLVMLRKLPPPFTNFNV